MDFKIMSFNIWCGGVTEERKAKVFAAIEKYSPDILGVQEATPQWMKILKDRFGDYEAAGIGREGGDEGEYSAIFTKKDRFEQLAEGTRWLSETPDSFSFVEGSLCPRIYTYVKLRDKKTGEIFCHINTHLDHGPEEVRMKQARFLYDFIETIEEPVSVSGDFNYEESASEVYKYFISGKLSDAKYLAKTRHAAPTFHGYKELKNIIDYIYVTSNGFEVKEYRVVDELFDGEHPSDHNPVVITAELKR